MNEFKRPRAHAHLDSVRQYLPGDAIVEGVVDIVKMSSNESPLGPSPLAKAAVAAVLEEIERYPDSRATAVRRAIAEHEGLDAGRIVCGAGSEPIINLIARTFAGPGDEIVYSRFGFAAYPIATQVAGATPVAADEVDYRADVDSLLAATTERTRVVFLANPNNPTGTYLPISEIGRLRDGLPEGVLLVLDSAYCEYVSESDYSNGLELVDRPQADTMVLRTFSKIHALASLRLGWAYGADHLATALDKARDVFNASMPAQAAAIASLSDTGHLERSRRHNRHWRPWLDDELEARGFTTVRGVGNFVLVRLDSQAEAEALDLHLRQRGLIPRTLVEYGLPHCLRVTVGLEEHNRRLVAAVEDFERSPTTRA